MHPKIKIENSNSHSVAINSSTKKSNGCIKLAMTAPSQSQMITPIPILLQLAWIATSQLTLIQVGRGASQSNVARCTNGLTTVEVSMAYK